MGSPEKWNANSNDRAQPCQAGFEIIYGALLVSDTALYRRAPTPSQRRGSIAQYLGECLFYSYWFLNTVITPEPAG